MNKKQMTPCGSWASPICAADVAKSAHGLSQVKVDDHCLYWLEQFPDQKGRSAIMCQDVRGNIRELTPSVFNVRTRVHEYGGGDYTVHFGELYFSNDQDQRLYRQDKNGKVIVLTPDEKLMAYRYADGVVTPDGHYFIGIRERHLDNHEVINEIVAVKTDGSFEIKILVSGDDFYAAPAISADGKKLLYLRWSHPQMPWDGTILHFATFEENFTIKNSKILAGGVDESIYQPSFNKAGEIYFVSDKTGWWNIYKYHEKGSQAVFSIDAEIGCPAWVFGTSMYAFGTDNNLICLINEKGRSYLANVKAGKVEKINTAYDTFYPYLAVDGDDLFCIAANAAQAPAIVKINVKTQAVNIIHSSSTLLIDTDYLSLPECIEFPTEKGKTAFANFYPPKNANFQPEKNELPPLMVICHGGPTASTTTALNLKIQFFTSRGFAVVDVNYGGSTGYGREYRERLNGQWGVVDVADCVNAAKYLVQQKRVDPKRLTIKGSSAGGLTVLAALTFYDIFAAGASYYGVADMEGLVHDTHKFEARYLDKLVGEYPAEKQVYQDRSPIFHTDKLSTPVIFLQGLEDKVVPPAQTDAMMAALDKKQLPYTYVTFPNEQHGFRESQSIIKALESELSFYCQVFGFKPADTTFIKCYPKK
jgi:dipeptidyl aminopeptidase/acylaminoacyl peptidase